MTDSPSQLRNSHFAVGYDTGKALLKAENDRLCQEVERLRTELEIARLALATTRTREDQE